MIMAWGKPKFSQRLTFVVENEFQSFLAEARKVQQAHGGEQRVCEEVGGVIGSSRETGKEYMTTPPSLCSFYHIVNPGEVLCFPTFLALKDHRDWG